ncbi:MAG: hypothetical protein NT178_06010 [Proteobacteria bacterium]|nr:hypothetical protein [Pseudomonadota bacterium]
MNIIFYIPGKRRLGKDFISLIGKQRQANSMEVLKEKDDLFQRLNEPYIDRIVILIYAATIDDLIDIYLMKHLLCKTTFLLILPNRERDVEAMGSLLKPYSMCSIEDNPFLMKALLIELTEQTDIRQKQACRDLNTCASREYIVRSPMPFDFGTPVALRNSGESVLTGISEREREAPQTLTPVYGSWGADKYQAVVKDIYKALQDTPSPENIPACVSKEELPFAA